MCDEEYDNIEYLTQLAGEVREALLQLGEDDWINSILEYYSENEDFPINFWLHLKDALKDTYPDYYFHIVRIGYDPDYSDTFSQSLFFPVEYEDVVQDGEELVFDAPKEIEIKPSLTPEEMALQQEELAANLASFLCIHPDVATAILRKNYWNFDKSMLDYSAHRHETVAALSIPFDSVNSPLELKPLPEPGLCDICYEEEIELLALPCGHGYCRQCWTDYVNEQISQGLDLIHCMDPECKCPLNFSQIKLLCSVETAETYQRFLFESQISMDQSLCHCPRPGCDRVLTADAVGLCSVATCACGYRICWKCRQDAHAPLSCELIDKWNQMTKQEVLEAKWFAENTKMCPKCKTHIEKNGGCNHMTCRKCHHEFCWICGHEWNSHVGSGYSCNKYTNFDDIDRDNIPKFDLSRLEHYHTRYMNHKGAIETEKKQHNFYQNRLVQAYMTYNGPESLPQLEAQKLAFQVIQSIEEARSVIVWSYPHAFFMDPGSTELRLFEFVQTNVERYIEEGSDLVENKWMACPIAHKQMSKLLRRNTETLMKHVDQYAQ